MNLKNHEKKKSLKLDTEILDKYLVETKELIYKGNNYTYWFQEMILKENLLEYFENGLPGLTDILFKNMIRECVRYDCEDDIQFLHLCYIAPIFPDDVEIEEWKELRKKRINKWGSYERLNRVYFDTATDKVLNINSLPIVIGEYDLENGRSKYKIGDGNHRFGFAKRNNIPTVICIVHDTYIIKKSWIEKHIDELKLKKEKDLKKRMKTT